MINWDHTWIKILTWVHSVWTLVPSFAWVIKERTYVSPWFPESHDDTPRSTVRVTNCNPFLSQTFATLAQSAHHTQVILMTPFTWFIMQNMPLRYFLPTWFYSCAKYLNSSIWGASDIGPVLSLVWSPIYPVMSRVKPRLKCDVCPYVVRHNKISALEWEPSDPYLLDTFHLERYIFWYSRVSTYYIHTIPINVKRTWKIYSWIFLHTCQGA